MTLIELKGISKQYGSQVVLEDINIEIKKNEIMVIMGHSGAGKTTLLRIMALLEPPSKGVYKYKGNPVKINGFFRKKVTMVFQSPVMFRGSVYDNIAYGLKLRGIEKKEIRDKVRNVLSLVELEGTEKATARKLSGGEQQRVALARALVLEPELLLMDEPTTNLDPTNVALIERVIMELARKNNTTVVIATHNLFQAKRLADRVAHLYSGKLVEIGDADKIFENPGVEITQKFITGELRSE
jgi:tungstate transport system ATP-binding protein